MPTTLRYATRSAAHAVAGAVTRAVTRAAPAARAAVPMVACAIAALLGASLAQGWPVKRFEVLNAEPGRSVDVPGDGGASDFAQFWIESVLEVAQDLGVFDPDLPGWLETVDLHPEAAREIEQLLGDAARVLEQWGFRPPALVPVVDTPDGDRAFRVYLVENLTERTGSGRDPHGVFEYSRGGGLIMLSAEHVLEHGRLTDRGAFTVVHELFHAVQRGTPFFAGLADGPVGDWIVEGTANAVALELVRALWNAEPDIVPVELHGRRAYSLPLPRIHERPVSDESYATSSFWRYLAEMAAIGTPGPEPVPADFTVLARMLEVGPVGRDCHENPIDCGSELAWLDAQLRTHFAKPLREVYALFVQAYAQYGAARAGAGQVADGWLVSSFAPCEPIVFRKHDEPDLGEAVGVAHVALGYFNQVGAACFLVTPRGYEGDVRVVVRIDDPEGARAIEDVTAGVEGRPLVAMSADVEGVGAEGTARTAAWSFDFVADETTAFFLTNVADVARRTEVLDGLDVTFTVVEEYARMGVRAGAAATAPARVFDALPLELGRVRQADVVPGRNELQERAGLIEPCALRFVMENPTTGDLLEVYLDHEVPIAPGTFDVALLADGRFVGPEEHPGAAVVAFGIGAGNPLAQGDAQAYGGQVGTLTIDAFTRDVVQGSVTVLGERSIDGRYVGDDWRAYPDELETVAVTAAFRLVPRLPTDMLGVLSIESCLHPDPARRVRSERPPIRGEAPPMPPDPPLPPDTDRGPRLPEEPTEASPAEPAASEPTPPTGPSTDVDASAHPPECRPFAFARGVEFAANPDLPFVFEHPDGWVHTRITEGARARGTFVPPVPTSGAIEYSAERLLTDREVAMADLVRSAFEELAIVDFGGDAIEVRGGAMGETSVAAFAVPIEGGVVSVQFLFMAPRGCDVALAEALRELLVRTLRPRP